MIASLDDNRRLLSSSGTETKDTLVVFASDNSDRFNTVEKRTAARPEGELFGGGIRCRVLCSGRAESLPDRSPANPPKVWI
jgi:hypothetical protein